MAKRRRRKKKGLLRIAKRYCRRWKKKSKTILLLCALFIAAIVAFNLFTSPGTSTRTRITSNGGKYDGIDVSKYQGKIDWTAVAEDSNIKFVYVKATEGASVVDKRYAENIKGARAAGLKVGSYHYFIARKPAREQFDNFRRNVRRGEQDLIPVVDVESAGNTAVSKQLLQSNLSEFMMLLKNEYGKSPILYSQYGFYNERLAPEFNKYYIFIARYGKREPILKGGGNYNIWQFSEKGRINGINGYVDLDVFANGTGMKDIEL